LIGLLSLIALTLNACRSAPEEAGGNGQGLYFVRPAGEGVAAPLDAVTVVVPPGAAAVTVSDGGGREYFHGAPQGGAATFTVGGRLGTHTVRALAAGGGEVGRLAFAVDARTKLDDEGGAFAAAMALFEATMRRAGGTGDGMSQITWRGTTYRCFVSWILDHSHTAKGMQYFDPDAGQFVDLLRQVQRKDGMVWSFARRDTGPGYYDTAYGPDGYAWRDGGALFARQPVENHCEYNFVDAAYHAWRASGDDAWMARQIDAVVRALAYAVTDPVRFSTRLGLLKRGYTIDSWDFQVDDAHTVKMDLATAQRIDPARTKFGAFFGDNHGYARACEQAAEMLDRLGRTEQAAAHRARAKDLRARLDAVAWNGRFFTHRIEEDPAVRRDLGVDERAQVAMSNAYALNRGITHEQAVAILRTYQGLRGQLPAGSPGEWYAIYPPFEHGFAKDGAKWQYMNGGVQPHAAGELARGAFEHGFEAYGADVLRRVADLGKKSGGIVRFAYTGAVEPPPPAAIFVPLDLSKAANMDLWDRGAAGVPKWMAADRAGNDMRNLPVGEQTFAGVPYRVTDPAANGRRAAVAVAHKDGFAPRAQVPVGAKAACLYLLHTAGGIGPSGVGGAVTLRYDDGTEHTAYVLKDKHLAGWWFPELKAKDAGVAWRGPNPCSNDVGVCWAALPNPHREKPIAAIAFSAALDGATYAVLGATLADRPPYVAPDLASFGGPDNWGGGLCMAALVEGLAGVAEGDVAFRKARVSPRWPAAGVKNADVTIRYAASAGYVAYRYRHDPAARSIDLLVTGSGDAADVRVLLPAGANRAVAATVNGQPVPAEAMRVGGSSYARLPVTLGAPAAVRVVYAE